MQRTILAGLKSLFHFEKPMIQKIACVDQVDGEILEMLFEADGAGLLPKDFAVRLSQFQVRRHQVSRRILRMEKRLEKELGQQVAEKRGWHWALTSFGFDVWGETEVEGGEEGITKVCFTKSTVHVNRMVNFGIVGEREVSIDLAWSEFSACALLLCSHTE